MASVPNMRTGPAPVIPGTLAPPVAIGAEFASLMPAMPDVPLTPVPVVPVEAGGDAPKGDVAPDADHAAPEDTSDEAAGLAALLPVIPTIAPAPAAPSPVAMREGSTTPSVAVSPAKAEVARVAKAPAHSSLPEAAVEAATPEAPQPTAKPAKSEKPKVARAPAAPAPIEIPAEQAEPVEKTIEAAKRVVEQALRQAPAAQIPTPVSAPLPRVRPQNAAVEREVAPAVETTQPAAPTSLVSAMASTAATVAVPAPAQAAAPQAAEVADRTIERELDLARDGEWLDRLARDIARTADGDAPMRFRLHPQSLGHMRVELSQGDHGTSVRLTVDTEVARAILADAQPRLAAEARAQGVRIAETHVDMSSDRHAAGDQRRQDEARQTPIIRTAREAAQSGNAPVQPGRSRSDRYA